MPARLGVGLAKKAAVVLRAVLPAGLWLGPGGLASEFAGFCGRMELPERAAAAAAAAPHEKQSLRGAEAIHLHRWNQPCGEHQTGRTVLRYG